jgi:tRNA-intron endonuclease
MEPYLKGSKVLVTDTAEASTLQNKGSFGRPVRGGELHLDLLEAVYLAENDRIKVTEGRRGGSMGWIDLLKRGLAEPGHFLGRYMVYRDLRNRGLVVRIGGEGGFLIYPRGTKGLNAKPSGWIHIHSEDDKVTLAGLDKKVRENDGMRIITLSAIFDSDWDVTYYNVRIPGIATHERDPEIPAPTEDDLELHLLNGCGALATRRTGGVFGSPRIFGTAVKDVLLLSREESFLMMEKEGKKTDGDDLRWKVYQDMEVKGFRVRSGLKYGCHFRVYTSRSYDDHSTHLVQCMDPKKKLSWEELARAIRLCHSVRKRMIYAFPVEGEGISYLEMEWTRP